MTPLLLDIKRNSLDDGPGIRSVVFFKGCPLSCVWCQNPEAIAPRAQLQRNVEACSECRACQTACPHDVARPAALAEARDRCQTCGTCVDVCPAAARRIAGRRLSVAQVLEQLLQDEPFFRRSGGGVTLSGGEPTMFVEFAGALAEKLRREGIDVLLETCGQFAWQPCALQLLPHVSTVYFDLKLAHAAAHRRHCGTDNRRIIENLERLVEFDGLEILPRVPLIPGITDSDENLAALADIIARVGLKQVALMPYNPLWLSKRRGLGLPLPYAHRDWMPASAVRQCERTMEARGLQLVRRPEPAPASG